MKLAINWLKDYIDPKLSMEQLAERLTMAGLEVETIEAVGGEAVLEIEVTPNRPDCLNILGLAREVGAITSKAVKYPKIKAHKAKAIKGLVHIENKKDCSRYIATLIKDVNITDAPREMKQRLSSMGLHAINNAVDVTNFVLMECGQPLHVFDYDKLEGGLVVRRAKESESLVTLDGVERKLDPRILVIADSKRPVAIAGIMGGRDTQITSETKNILLESAHFEMGLIRRSCRLLGLRSDSSYRFERNVSFQGVLTGADRATDLLLSLTQGHLAGRCEIASGGKSAATKIRINVSDIESLLGLKLSLPKVKAWLDKLGLKVSGNAQQLTVTVPQQRMDLKQDVDVIEEIARMIGFDRLPSRLPVIPMANIPVDNGLRKAKEKIRQVLMAGGVDEIITHSMIDFNSMAKAGMADLSGLKILNPLSQDQAILRPQLIPSFLKVVSANFNRGQKDLRFFEIGKVYCEEGEKETVGILLAGRRNSDWRIAKKDNVDFFDLKGLLDRVFESLGAVVNYETAGPCVFDGSCTADIFIDGEPFASFGKIDQKFLDNWDLKNYDIYFAGLYLEDLVSKSNKSVKYQTISEFPAIVRDVSLAVKKEIPYAKIEEICWQQGGDILKSVDFIEQYLGDKIQPGFKGLVFSCQYQSYIRTLREDEVTAAHERILQRLGQDLNVIRR